LALFGRGNQADIGQQTYRIYRIGVLTRAADQGGSPMGDGSDWLDNDVENVPPARTAV
jgi:hypothetical protein